MKKSGDRSTPAVSPARQKSQDTKKKALFRQVERVHDEAHTAAQGLTRAFGRRSAEEVPAIDAVIMGRLREAFNSIDEDLHTACFERGLLPRTVGTSLRMACS